MIPPSELINALAEWRDSQLEKWPLAKVNYEALNACERKIFKIGDFEGVLQLAPHRINSTAAKVDSASIKERKCFLCSANRPSSQLVEELIPGWDFLVNPYPILPMHFTIVSQSHQPQGAIPTEIVSIAERLPGMVVFFNGAKAGASAPDHLHCQAVLKSELPLISFLESGKDPDLLPYKVNFSIITPDVDGMITLNTLLAVEGVDKKGKNDKGLVNGYFWMGDDGFLRVCIIPRKSHRPDFYTNEADGNGRMVSPGAIDMAGVIVLPREKDFQEMGSADVEMVYNQTAWKN